MNTNLHGDGSMNGMMDFGMGTMAMGANPADPTQNSFVQQLHEVQSFNVSPPLPEANFDLNDLASKNRNRGNYRCSKCGEPKKGHVCPLVPSNFKCNRCGLPKKSCTCAAATTRSIGIQCEMDEDMTTRMLDLSAQGVIEFHKSIVGYVTPPTST